MEANVPPNHPAGGTPCEAVGRDAGRKGSTALAVSTSSEDWRRLACGNLLCTVSPGVLCPGEEGEILLHSTRRTKSDRGAARPLAHLLTPRLTSPPLYQISRPKYPTKPTAGSGAPSGATPGEGVRPWLGRVRELSDF